MSLSNVYAGYGHEIVLHDVDLDIYERDFIGIIGPNGGGKTTLVRVILGLIKPVKGSVKIQLQGMNNSIRNIGYLPQSHNIDTAFPISVMEVVLSGLAGNDTGKIKHSKKNKEAALRLMAKMGIGHLADRPVGDLSGGQLQRTMVCRAVISDPALLILDEPGTFVDSRFENELYELLKELNKEMAVVVVTHDLGTVSAYIKTIVCVNRKVYYHPSNKITGDQLQAYGCPIQLITHGDLPHTVLKTHPREGGTDDL